MCRVHPLVPRAEPGSYWESIAGSLQGKYPVDAIMGGCAYAAPISDKSWHKMSRKDEKQGRGTWVHPPFHPCSTPKTEVVCLTVLDFYSNLSYLLWHLQHPVAIS